MTMIMAIIPGCGSQVVTKMSGLVVINVLDKELFEDCHIKGSIHIPFDQIDTCRNFIDKNAEIVIYCSNYQCTTSEYAARKLKELGYANVSVYEGGMAEWYQGGLPVEGPCQKKYLTRPLRKVTSDNEQMNIVVMEDLALKMEIEIKSNAAA